MAKFTAGMAGGGQIGGNGSDPGGTGGSDPGDIGRLDPGQLGGNGSDPGGTGGSDPGGTGGSDPGGTGGSDPGGTGGGGPSTPPRLSRFIIAQKKLNFRIQMQEQSEWCWAAVAASVERYFNPASTLQQCDVANRVFPKEFPTVHLPPSDCGCCCKCCCDPESCNRPAELEIALQQVHKWRNTLKRPLTFEEIQREIDRGRPVGVGITWASGGGHFVVLRGYRLLRSGSWQVYVADPLNASGLLDLDEFTMAYYGDGAWTETDLVQSGWA
jgi:Papain-like cysteine protease AvrRpt2